MQTCMICGKQHKPIEYAIYYKGLYYDSPMCSRECIDIYIDNRNAEIQDARYLYAVEGYLKTTKGYQS